MPDRKIILCDVEGTLIVNGGPNQSLVALLNQANQKGYTIHIVSKAFDSEAAAKKVFPFVQKLGLYPEIVAHCYGKSRVQEATHANAVAIIDDKSRLVGQDESADYIGRVQEKNPNVALFLPGETQRLEDYLQLSGDALGYDLGGMD